MPAPSVSGGGLPGVVPDEARAKLDEKIKSLKLKDKEREAQTRAAAAGLPYFNLQGFPISADSISLVPEETARRLRVVCYWFGPHDVRLGALDPTTAEAQTYATALAREHFAESSLSLISEESFRLALEAYQRVPKVRRAAPGVTVTEEDLNRAGSGIGTLHDLEPSFRGAPTTEVVTMVIAGGLKTRASDVHLEAEEEGVKLRYRIDGVLHTVATLPRASWPKVASRLKLLSGLKINVSDRPQDGRFTITLTKDKVDVRVSALPTAYGESIVMRLLHWSAAGIEFEALGLVGRGHELLLAELKKPHGMIITTGPTGAGKTTTLYAIINKLNNAETKIITIEDPVEYKLAGVNQSQVDASRGYTFANGLRSILRQDPNVVMVGEIRDPETAEIAVQAALTGHLVLSSLHTNDAAGAIPRFLSLGAKSTLLPSALNAIVGQRLVRRLCEACKVEDKPEAAALKQVATVLASLPSNERTRVPAKQEFFKGGGCDECQGLGFRGQVGIFEVLLITKAIKEAVAGAELSDTKVSELARAAGMVTMLHDGVLKALAGVTSLSEVFRVTRE